MPAFFRPQFPSGKSQTSFARWICASLLLGFLWGLFFGETTPWVGLIGDIYIGLLQMAVLPYVAISLVANVGRLARANGVRLLSAGAIVLVGLWTLGMIALLVMSNAFPVSENGSFYSSRFTEEPEPIDWIELFIPSNPFRALSDNAIPAVVVFSIGLGVALIGLPNKAQLLDPLDVALAALAKLNRLVVKLTPLGMFGIAAHAFGTLGLEQFKLIQGFLLTYCFSATVLSLVILPALVASVTPLRLRDVLQAMFPATVTAFVIGNTFAVLPMITASVSQLLKRIKLEGSQDSSAEYLVPLGYPFPDIGRILGLVFIPFAAWFYGTSIESDRVAPIFASGLLGAFAKPIMTIPWLLELAELPSDIFNLYVASGVFAARFGDITKAAHLMTFSIIVWCLVHGVAQFNWRRFLPTVAISLAMITTGGMLIRSHLESSFKSEASSSQAAFERDMLFHQIRPHSTVTVVERSVSDPASDSALLDNSRVKQIQSRGTIRIGYDPDKLPFAFYRQSAEGQRLTGFDIEMAHFLADDLNVDLEFVRIEDKNLLEQLHQDAFDVAMSAIEGTVQQAVAVPSADPYLEVTLAIVVPDHQKRYFRDVKTIAQIPNLRLAVVRDSYFAERAKHVLPPDVDLVELESAGEYFSHVHQTAHGLVISAEAGSAWTIRRPQFTVTNPLAGRIHVPLYYLTAPDPQFQRFLQNWLTLKRSDGTFQELYDYWVLGAERESPKQRWCIIRDVLGWVD